MKTLRLALFALFAILAPSVVLAQAPPPVPGLPDTPRLTSYALTGSTCACAVNFALYGDSTDYWDWVEVWINGVNTPYNSSTAPWTITSPTGPVGNIPRPITDAVLTFGQPVTGTIELVGARRPRRVTQFQESRGVPARDLNQALTDIIAMLREDWDKINDVTGRALVSQPGNVLGNLPLPSLCANNFLTFDSTGLNPVCAAVLNPIVTGAGVAQALQHAINGPSGIAVFNANGTLSYTDASTTNPALFFQGQGAPNTANQVAVFTNDGTTETSILGPVYYSVLSGVLNMCYGAGVGGIPASPPCLNPFFEAPSLLQQNAASFTLIDSIPQGPALQVTGVNAGAHQFTVAGNSPAGVAVNQIVDDVTALNGNSIATSATPVANGTGGANGSAVYSVGGGTCSVQPTINVTWTAGVLSFNSIQNAGQCTVSPTTGAALTYSSGAATGWTGATVNLTSAPTYGCILGTSCGLSGAVTISNINRTIPSAPVYTMSGAFGTTISVGDTMKFYAAAGNGSSNGVGLEVNASCNGTGAACWNINTQIGNNANQHFANLEIYEADALNNQADAGVDGFNLIGVSSQSGVSGGFLINLMDVTGLNRAKWGSGMYQADGCCTFGYIHPAALPGGANNPGAPDEWFASDGNNNPIIFETIATAQGFEFGCSNVTAPTVCAFDYGAPIYLTNGATYDKYLSSNGHIASIVPDAAITAIGFGNSTANVTMQGPNLILAGNLEMNTAKAIFINGENILSDTAHAVTIATDAGVTSTTLGGSSQTVNLIASILQIGGTAGVSCAAGTVTLLTEVITKGIVTHC